MISEAVRNLGLYGTRTYFPKFRFSIVPLFRFSTFPLFRET